MLLRRFPTRGRCHRIGGAQARSNGPQNTVPQVRLGSESLQRGPQTALLLRGP